MTSDELDRYLTMRSEGMTHRLAEALATRKFPGIKGSNSNFMAGTHAQDTQLDHYRYMAAQDQGIDTNGKRYLSSLARWPGDAEAWIGSLDEVVDVVRRRGWNCSGAVDYTGFDPSREGVDLNDKTVVAGDIVQSRIEDRLEEIPEGDRAKLLPDIEDRVRQELTGMASETPAKVGDYDDPFSLPGMEPDADD